MLVFFEYLKGVFGLRRAFQLAGARTVVMSLWSVPDEETAALMADFYGRLAAGEGKARALQLDPAHPKALYNSQGIKAAEFDKPLFLQIVGTGITTALSLPLGSVLTHAQWPAVNCMDLYKHDLLATPLTIDGGYARTSDSAGLGITVDEEALTRYRIEPPYEPPPL